MIFDAGQLQEAMERLRAGEVIAAPAEGVYGYCADPFNPIALKNLLDIKRRQPGKGFVVLISSLKQLTRLCPPLPCAADDSLDHYWPGQTTLILPARTNLDALLTGDRGTVAVRFPKAPHVLEYLKAWGGPLVSTSANLTGQTPAVHATELPSGLFVLPTPHALDGSVSRIIDPLSNKVIR